MATKKTTEPKRASKAAPVSKGASKSAPATKPAASPTPAPAAPPAPLNREQRRRQKFGNAGKVHQHDPIGPWPQSEANPALINATEDQAAETGHPNPDVTRETGTGDSSKG